MDNAKSRYRCILVSLMILAFPFGTAVAQYQLPDGIPTPNTAALGRYGFTPVSYYIYYPRYDVVCESETLYGDTFPIITTRTRTMSDVAISMASPYAHTSLVRLPMSEQVARSGHSEVTEYGYAAPSSLLTSSMFCLHPVEVTSYEDGSFSCRQATTYKTVTCNGSAFEVPHMQFVDYGGGADTVAVCMDYSTTGTLLSYRERGKPLSETHVLLHGASCDTVRVAREYSQYNDALVATSVSYNGGQPVQVSAISYDGLGRVATVTRPSASATVSYGYNVRGWVTSISSAAFCESLGYDGGPGAPLYGGDASSVVWHDGSGQPLRGYAFSYDELGRLVSADYGEGPQLSENQGRYTEDGFAYTPNGSITALRRYGKLNASGYGLVDDLSVALDGDLVSSVTDGAVSLAWTDGFDFKAGGDGVYTYDGDGSLLHDPDKKATFTYDLRGNPTCISMPSYDKLFVYGADGEKLETKFAVRALPTPLSQIPAAGVMELPGLVPGGLPTPFGEPELDLGTPRRYCGPFVTFGSSLGRFLFDGGYATFGGDSAKFHFYVCDHLGNVRAVVGDDGAVEQRTHYYPFGGVIGDISTSPGVQPCKFGGKEYEHGGGLDLYDFGSRLYDPALCVWTSTDPLAEKCHGTSHHAYCGDNPVRYVDPDGRYFGDYITGKGVFLGSDGKDDGRLYVLKTRKSSFDSYGNAPVAGISRKEHGRVVKERDISNMQNFVEITGSQKIREAAVSMIGDDGNGGEHKHNNREYLITFDTSLSPDNTDMIHCKEGPVGDPSKDDVISISVGNFPSLVYIHTHPSGYKGECRWQQAPSSEDVENTATQKYVIGMGDKTVYVYNHDGINASLPLDVYKNYVVTSKK